MKKTNKDITAAPESTITTDATPQNNGNAGAPPQKTASESSVHKSIAHETPAPENIVLDKPEIIITSHVNADFDALSSMVAAKKLYPDATLISPPYREKSGVNYFLDSIAYVFNFKHPKDCDLSSVKRLVVVDTRQRNRINHISEVLNNPGLEIDCYDHHPDSEDDLPAKFSIVKEWGSTIAILVQLLREKGLTVTPDEATMLGLGLYEDTGSFTYSSTTEYDLLAAAWLRPQAMDLSVISDHMNTTMTTEQISVLNRMIENAETHDLHGVSIMLSEIVLEEYFDDFAVLAHQIMDMENVKVIFAMAQMGDRVQLVARSRVPEQLNVSKICTSFGGGGHSYAAAASIKDKTMAEVKSELFAMVFSTIHDEINVGAKMTSPAKVVKNTSTLAQAEAMMIRFGLKAVPVVAAGSMRAVGFLEYQTAARAVSHQLGSRPVYEFMNSRARTVRPTDSLYPAMEIILGQRQRLVSVVDEKENIVGVLTRTDVMRLLLDETIHIPEGTPLGASTKDRNISGIMHDKLPEKHCKLLKTIGELGDKLNTPVYAVGGFVRDLLMDRVNLDIDITVEGDGITFAKNLAERLNGRFRTHPKFQTALVIFTDEDGNEERIDVATARLEYYEAPGALPTVELSSIKMDLSRRDFTINALAIRLNPAHFGTLVDPFGAQRDMKEKAIRVLHSLSFIEDPTRILRAIRFEKRFGFKIDPQTDKLIKNCLKLGMFKKISGARVFNELRHIFDEKSPMLSLDRMEGYGILRMIHPLLRLAPTKLELLNNAEEVISWYKLLYLKMIPQNWIIYLMGLCPNANYKEMSEVLETFLFIERPRQDFMLLREATRMAEKSLQQWEKQEQHSMGKLFSILHRVPIEGILYMMSKPSMQSLKKVLSHYLSRLWDLKLEITGHDILVLGAKPGPQIGEILKHVLEAKADGRAETREEQLNIATAELARLNNMTVEELMIMEISAGRT